jgi:hypothetical protein
LPAASNPAASRRKCSCTSSQNAALAEKVELGSGRAGLMLRVGEHQVADHADLVIVGDEIRRHQPADDLRLARVGDVEDRRSLGAILVTHIGEVAVDRDLPTAGKLHPRQMTNVRGCKRARGGAGVGCLVRFGHDRSPVMDAVLDRRVLVSQQQ